MSPLYISAAYHTCIGMNRNGGSVVIGLVSPGAATDSVTPTFFLKKTDDLFSHHRLSVLHCHPLFFLTKTDDLFCSSLSLLLITLGVTPWRVSPVAVRPPPTSDAIEW